MSTWYNSVERLKKCISLSKVWRTLDMKFGTAYKSNHEDLIFWLNLILISGNWNVQGFRTKGHAPLLKKKNPSDLKVITRVN